VRPRGKIVLKTTPAAVPGASMTAIDLGSGVDLSRAVCNELEIIGSRCGKISDAVNALAKGEVEVQSMISRRFKLAEGVAAIKAAAEKSMVKVLIDV
jgi:threonine dehydrogenase-like Zn-dependent dehydrogenase